MITFLLLGIQLMLVFLISFVYDLTKSLRELHKDNINIIHSIQRAHPKAFANTHTEVKFDIEKVIEKFK